MEVAERILDAIRSEDSGTQIPAEVARTSAAEIAVVCIGRKPLYHVRQCGGGQATGPSGEDTKTLPLAQPPRVVAAGTVGVIAECMTAENCKKSVKY